MLQVRQVISLVTSHPYLPFCRHIIPICDRIWEKGPYRAFKKNRVITTVGKSRLRATKCATYLVMKAKCSGVIAVSVHSSLATAIG